MNLRNKNVVSCLCPRPWLAVPLGVCLAILLVYLSRWLLSRITLLETQNRVVKTQSFHSIPDAPGTSCETVHIAIVCMGKCMQTSSPMLKSLLHHRQSPLHFHFIVDDTSQLITEVLFDTWDLPDVKYTCYNAQNRMFQVKWIPNNHYSGFYALLKLLFHDILPDALEQVIVLDTDLTILCDVAELWTMFTNMTDEQFIGLVENESDWYSDPNEWPALGRGYNMGVMLLDLRKIRNTDWTTLWHEVLNGNLDRLKQTTLAEQDVINGVIKKRPQYVYNISCRYNVQLSSHTLAKNCYGEDTDLVVHWNSPKRQFINIKDADVFRNIRQSYVNFNGNILNEILHRCGYIEPITYKSNHSDPCKDFRAAHRVKLRTHLYYMDYSYTVIDNFDVTLVVQLSMDKLQCLERLANYWEGPISAAIYLSDCDLTKLETYIRVCSNTLSTRRNIGYHLVFKHDSLHYYPVNYLRNVALEHVNTPYVFLMDADFVPMAALYAHLRSAVRLINPYAQKKCLVVAAFEMHRHLAIPPRNKRDLLSRLSNKHKHGDMAPFRAREWPRGHRATNYSRWAVAKTPYEVDWRSDYEPYLVVHRSVPKYDTRFSSFSWAKVSHSVELRAQGYQPVVLPGAFVVHTPDAPLPQITAFKVNQHYWTCQTILQQEFMSEIQRKYNVSFKEPSKHNPYYIRHAKTLRLRTRSRRAYWRRP